LITPFAFLLYNQQDATLSALEGMDVNGEPGINIFVRKWCEHPEYQGLWQGRINALALAHLFASGRPSVQNLRVRGDLIIKPQTEKGA
jgi:importin-9